ncbi:MAG TPA: ATP synthase F1 subunit epsilon [Candidatus Peribacter riflensis]|uniref:ATP synthase epsilon chain n=1 Tax=Candidatus Peribacter riflensis TaxID=1735162 RepID=A0A0S1SSG6_9BACT|nr:MAG: F-type H +-transporting ATPase subunit epsilon [Candidatus Peribacter riflensis]OGJ78107.1 MAG: ATP synthase F1 subunit epsilon [Candidatus Peribacteria bacterium RIFOXYC1_FULL_58_8]OGJ79357.1 MAG: ATP synthase F1 subunit epsilon [Candidatus Peribacteria bacterium RIFOXYB1_FULL_57_12]ALM10670.1 MAG: F-type H +-transporting ATPase subunit epsilon [Candidatus Peribacter riflensis]ALM11772.1 MAG: F-type H +-transporting ATPase subunit epsilon [Candidatus Peribacter riflensis]
MLRLEITTPDRPMFEGEVDSVSLPTPQGEITILPHHIPLISIVSPGAITIRQKGSEQLLAVSRGVIEVDGKTIRVMVDTADRADELQEEAILKAKAEAEKLQREKREDREGFAEATAILERELARLHVVRRRRGGRRSVPTPGSGE